MKKKKFFTLEIEKELKSVMDEIFTDMMQVERYAGTAYCLDREEESDAKFWLGQYKALHRTYEAVQKRMFLLQMEREKEENV